MPTEYKVGSLCTIDTCGEILYGRIEDVCFRLDELDSGIVLKCHFPNRMNHTLEPYKPILPKGLTIKKVIFNPPATIVLWSDGTKTVVKCQNEAFDREKGLAMAVAKKALGNRSNFNNEFKKWIDEDDEYDKGNCAKTYSMLDALDRISKLFGDKQ